MMDSAPAPHHPLAVAMDRTEPRRERALALAVYVVWLLPRFAAVVAPFVFNEWYGFESAVLLTLGLVLFLSFGSWEDGPI